MGREKSCVCESNKWMGKGKSCVCNESNRWVGREKSCVCNESNRWVGRGKSGVCNESNRWVGREKSCVCVRVTSGRMFTHSVVLALHCTQRHRARVHGTAGEKPSLCHI